MIADAILIWIGVMAADPLLVALARMVQCAFPSERRYRRRLSHERVLFDHWANRRFAQMVHTHPDWFVFG